MARGNDPKPKTAPASKKRPNTSGERVAFDSKLPAKSKSSTTRVSLNAEKKSELSRQLCEDGVEECRSKALKICSERFYQENAPSLVALELRDAWLKIFEVEGPRPAPSEPLPPEFFTPDDPPLPLQYDSWARGNLGVVPTTRRESGADQFLNDDIIGPGGDWNDEPEDIDEQITEYTTKGKTKPTVDVPKTKKHPRSPGRNLAPKTNKKETRKPGASRIPVKEKKGKQTKPKSPSSEVTTAGTHVKASPLTNSSSEGSREKSHKPEYEGTDEYDEAEGLTEEEEDDEGSEGELGPSGNVEGKPGPGSSDTAKIDMKSTDKENPTARFSQHDEDEEESQEHFEHSEAETEARTDEEEDEEEDDGRGDLSRHSSFDAHRRLQLHTEHDEDQVQKAIAERTEGPEHAGPDELVHILAPHEAHAFKPRDSIHSPNHPGAFGPHAVKAGATTTTTTGAKVAQDGNGKKFASKKTHNAQHKSGHLQDKHHKAGKSRSKKKKKPKHFTPGQWKPSILDMKDEVIRNQREEMFRRFAPRSPAQSDDTCSTLDLDLSGRDWC